MKEKIFEIEDNIRKLGYDTFIEKENLYVLKNGVTTNTPLENIENLIGGKVPMKTKDIISLITNNHKKRTESEDGHYNKDYYLKENDAKSEFKKLFKNKFEEQQREEIEKKLNLDDPEIKMLHNTWDKGDCSLVGIVEIYLYQCIKNHKEENGSYYDKDYDKIVLRYGNKQ